MSLRWKVHTPALEADVDITINEDNPLRIALLGGAKSGKLSIASRLSFGLIPDTYYPTRSTNPILFHYVANHNNSRSILDPTSDNFSRCIANIDDVELGPVLEHVKSIAKGDSHKKKIQAYKSDVHTDWMLKQRTEYYKCIENRSLVLANSEVPIPPQISPILIEFIDTPPFNPDQVVPFLEASLYMKLDPEILRNLANEPPKPVLTNPLLVASGAGEMNGFIDGYFFVYSAIPSYNPPLYDQMKREKVEVSRIQDNSFNLLETIKGALDEAWMEYNTFRKSWAQGQEGDIFLLKGAVRGFLGVGGKSKKMDTVSESDHSDSSGNFDPSDPLSPPPIWIICTHVDSELALPNLVENGKKLAKKWNCGYISVDCTSENGNVEEALALLIREIIERKRLQKLRLRK